MLPSIAKLASKHGIAPLKKYGQNFIFDESLCDKIVHNANISGKSRVLEIGPGPAGLTRSILKSAPNKLSVIETDSRCLPLLEEIKESYPILDINHCDALKMKLSSIIGSNDNNDDFSKLDIISNLPYNIGTQLIINWIGEIQHVNSLTLMLQKEVVDRIISAPSLKTYGRLSIICQLVFDANKCFDVSPKAFYPSPKIWSSIVRLVPKNNIPSNDILQKLGQITNMAFSGRRKMLKSSLKKIDPNIAQIFEMLGFDPTLRAENLSPQDYLKLAEEIN